MKFVELNEEAYQEFADNCPYRNVWQSVEMSKLRASNGWTTHYVALQESEITIAACALVSYPVLKKYRLFQALRGFLLDYENTEILAIFHEEIMQYMKLHNGIHFSMDPYVQYVQHDKFGKKVENGFDHIKIVEELKQLGYEHEGFTRNVNEDKEEPRWMFVLPLEGKKDSELLKEMNQLTRRSIKKTQRAGFSLVELQRSELVMFRDIISHTAERKGFSDRPLAYYEKMYDIFHPKERIKYLLIVLNVNEYVNELKREEDVESKKLVQIQDVLEQHPDNEKSMHKLETVVAALTSIEKKLHEADHLRDKYGNEIVLSGAMFLLYGDEILYLSGGSYDEMMNFSAQYRLQWEMISYAANNNYKKYNFYGIDGSFDEGQTNGVLAFKQGFSGEVQELIGVFHYILNPPVYHSYQSLKKMKNKVKGWIS